MLENPNGARLVDEREAARMLACSVHMLRSLRLKKEPPYWYKIGRLVRYGIDDLERYLACNKVGGLR